MPELNSLRSRAIVQSAPYDELNPKTQVFDDTAWTVVDPPWLPARIDPGFSLSAGTITLPSTEGVLDYHVNLRLSIAFAAQEELQVQGWINTGGGWAPFSSNISRLKGQGTCAPIGETYIATLFDGPPGSQVQLRARNAAAGTLQIEYFNAYWRTERDS